MTATFFIPGKIESGNKRQRTHWRKRYRQDKKVQLAWMALINIHCPGDLFVSEPHARRRVALTVLRKGLLDRDNLWSGLKPFIDVLRCRLVPGTGTPSWEGIVWDDSPRYLDLQVSQRVIVEGEAIGVLVEVDVPRE